MGKLDDITDAFTTTTTSARHAGLTFKALKETIDALGPPPKEPEHWLRIGDHAFPIKEFKLDLQPKLAIDEAHGPDRSILTVWQHEQLKATLEIKPSMCSWISMDGRPFDGSTGQFVPFTIKEVRNMRKHMRTKKGKETLKTIRQTPALCQQDPRKLRRLARRNNTD